MPPRFRFTDIHDYATPVEIGRAVSRKIFVYVEGINDIPIYEILAGPDLRAYVEFIVPQSDFQIRGGRGSVLKALELQQRRDTDIPYFGLCDGDYLPSLGQPLRLTEANDMFIEPAFEEFGVDVVFLGFHELENALICEGSAFEYATEFPLGITKKRPAHELAALRAEFELRAQDLLSSALRDFAVGKVYFDKGIEEVPFFRYEDSIYSDKIEKELQSISSSVESNSSKMRRSTSNMSHRQYDVFRLCEGRELLVALANLSKARPGYIDAATISLRDSGFGKAFRWMLTKRVQSVLGITL